MNAQLWLNRAQRLGVRFTWSALARVVEPPRIEVVHRPDRGEGLEGEWVRRCDGRAYIEPGFGYSICDNGYLLDESMLPNDAYDKAPWRIATASPGAFFKSRRSGTAVKHYPSVISMRHFWEWNYYHFFLDVLGKIRLFDEAGIDPATPLVLGRYAMELPWVRQILEHGKLKDRNWIVQDKFYVSADQLYYCRAPLKYKMKMDHLMDIMGVPQGAADSTYRLFLSRKPGSPRSIVNMDEILPILRKYDFDVVDTAALPVADQIRLFSKVRYLAAVHGAGMTNMCFRRDAPMSVLEIHARDYVSVDFLNICKQWGYRNERLACEGVDRANHAQHADLRIDPEQLSAALDQMLSEPVPARAQAQG